MQHDPLMHESVMRLLEFAKSPRSRVPRIRTITDVRKALDISSALMTQWKARGVSKTGAEAAEAIFGCPAIYILHGVQTVEADLASLALPRTEQSIGDAISELARRISTRSRVERNQLAGLLESLAREPEDREEACKAIAAIIEPAVPFLYEKTWEETAREVADLYDLKMPTPARSAADFINFVDDARNAGQGTRVTAVKTGSR